MSDDRSKTVLITGASGNLGQAAVTKFLQEGYRVIGVVSPGKKANYVRDGDVEIVEADLANEGMTAEVVASVIKKYETLDGALLLAGGYSGGGIIDARTENLDQMIAMNFKTAYHVARPIFMHMKKQDTGGRIILVGARAAMKPADGKNSVAYSLSKSLLFALADLLNAEGASANVVTSVIVPGTIDTPENRKSMPSAEHNKWVTPDEIVAVMEFLCSAKGRSLREPVIKMYGKV